ncbi:hypothetical protein R6258_16465 [Halomonas sp. HP20-15]|uniref:hypothetical protein n=1 Tax=Halomonas sp. HP20-15 TaxID=3085901 RepID=UPI002980DA70|nr:hypothetical protein [Halomonas sp. HP20-15]MDW5378514.1 hypothetical protein [Halomonas sp. HP20-15]
MHNLIIPLATCVIAFAAIFGYQAFSDSQLDERIEQAIAASLASERRDPIKVELTAMHEVNKGYGVCGEYALASPTDSGGAFFYSKVSERVTLGADSERYRANCGER